MNGMTSCRLVVSCGRETGFSSCLRSRRGLFVRFGIVGCGVISSAHAGAIEALGDRGELVAACDVDSAVAEAFAAKHGCGVEKTPGDLFGRSDVDAVAICVASGLHADLAVAALEAGKHVIVEKPLDITLAAADRIIAAERRSLGVVATISQRRFEVAAQFVNRVVRDGDLGAITSGMAECTWWRSQQYYDSAGWRGTWAMDGGGALMNQGIHQVDMLIWMLGRPVEVTAFAGTLAHERLEVEDTVAAVVRFESGAIGSLTATTAANPGLPLRLSVHGDAGLATIEGNKLGTFALADPAAGVTNTLANPGGAASGDGGGRRAALLAEADEIRVADVGRGNGMNHPAQYAEFVDAVDNGRAPAVTSADGRRAVELVLGVYESARSGRPVALGG
ncbi:Gfo/Idh/MocA family protein [Phytoactinopolyspora limicola]|uniref:Gfo/Idh/MocA family protein n=1 Tax=Phytoactinopolyspora limicola TaxID=2715536 RepID=UPI0014093D75|nr:Gfo/Idh/MocA family oxidoreductase [Phytoactinopolyspora limicola]